LQIEFDQNDIATPNFLGVQEFRNIPLENLVPFIDWTPFFQTWELHGRFPKILEDEIVGSEAKKLYQDAVNMLDEMVSHKWIEARAVIGLFPANSVGDDIEIYSNEQRIQVVGIQHTLRQQTKKVSGQPNLALSDFIAPKETGIKDYIGGFVVTTGIGLEKHVERFEKDHDDYNSIMVKALADRLAEALAEHMHREVRLKHWGYAVTENLSNDELIKESYRGIRPAPGYPACPDHLEKIGLFNLLNATELTGVSLTETLAMLPASSVSGWYFGHPHAKYFGLGKINQDQLEDVANRKKIKSSELKKWYSSFLNN
jgi:5-methyltetrahydrofolate--homocysteine methyltransferase